MKWEGGRHGAGVGTLLIEFGIAVLILTAVLRALGVG